MKRWTCPSCGRGKFAPARPQGDDVRVYCLSCSEKTGRLVRRVCPALEAEKRRRAERSEMDRVQSKERGERLRRQYEIAQAERNRVHGVDLIQAAAQLWRIAGGSGPVPPVRVRRSGRPGGGVSGRAWDESCVGRENRVYLNVMRDASLSAALSTLLHELVHIVVGCRHNHDDVFNARLARSARRAWGIALRAGERGYARSRELDVRLLEREVAGEDVTKFGGDGDEAVADR